MIVPDLYVIHTKKITPFFYATFQCGCFNVFKKKFVFVFSHKKLKKPPSKVAHNRPKPFISQSSPAHGPELIFHIIKCREQASVLLSVSICDTKIIV